MKFGGGFNTNFEDKLAIATAGANAAYAQAHPSEREAIAQEAGGKEGNPHRRRRPPRRRGDKFSPRLTPEMLRSLLTQTNMTRTELYRLFNRFKALCKLSGTPGSISKETFKDGVSSLAFEDDVFVDRVFQLLDEDSSGTVEWAEFVNAVNALETGSKYDKLVFCFRVYDRDNSNTIEREVSRFRICILRPLRRGVPSSSNPLPIFTALPPPAQPPS